MEHQMNPHTDKEHLSIAILATAEHIHISDSFPELVKQIKGERMEYV
jgi:hypothetical protein